MSTDPAQQLPARARQALRAIGEADWLASQWSGSELVEFMREFGASPLDFFRAEGYWRSELASDGALPFPESEGWDQPAADAFVALMTTLEAELERRRMVMGFMGFSRCRLCGCTNGSTEYFFQGWKWPAGLRHYVEAHRVVPSSEFQALVTRAVAKLG